MQSKARRLNLWYKYKISPWHKLFSLLAVVVAVAAGSALGGYSPLFVSGVTALLLTGIHLAITNYGLIPTVLVWAVNLAAVPFLSILIASSAPPHEGDQVMISTAIGLTFSSILWTYFAYKHSSGKLWVTLSIVFSVQATLATYLIGFLGIGSFSAIIVLLAGGLGYLIRYYAVRVWKTKRISRRNVGEETGQFQKLPPMSEKKRLQIIKQLKNSDGVRLVSEGGENEPAVLVTKRGIMVIFFHAAEEPVNFTGKKAPSYKKNSLSAFTAFLLKSTTHNAPGVNKPYTVLVVDDNGIKNNAFKIDVLSLESKMEGSVIVSHQFILTKTLNQLPVVTYTEDEVNKVVQSVQGNN